MDDAGVDSAHLFAQSEGGATTLLFAATYPHRVHSVILLGSSARMDVPEIDERTRDEKIAVRRAFADVWGTPDSMAVTMFAPSQIDNADFCDWHVRYERLSASSDAVFDLLVQMLDMDVRDIATQIEAPVLVMHRTDDQAMPLMLAREVAELVPNSTFIEFPGHDHFGYLGDIDAWMDEIERWVNGTVRPRNPPAPPADVAIRTLGTFAVSVSGCDVPSTEWGSRRARVLLKRLITARGQPVTRDELFDLLWPDETDRTKLGARLSVQLSGVRKVLGGGVTADRDTVALDLAHVSIDIEHLLDNDDDAQIVDRYSGEFLAENRYDDWTIPLRETLRTTFTGAAHRVLTDAIDSDDHVAAIDIARRIIEADPLDDLAHASLIDALSASGDGAAAQRARDERERLHGPT
jgi:DNA-binding SARP family transcriptional activator